ncbi:hypothetical protein GCM10027089_37560 [Nocardia thraciensis]
MIHDAAAVLPHREGRILGARAESGPHFECHARPAVRFAAAGVELHRLRQCNDCHDGRDGEHRHHGDDPRSRVLPHQRAAQQPRGVLDRAEKSLRRQRQPIQAGRDAPRRSRFRGRPRDAATTQATPVSRTPPGAAE